jgi:hypothetical protein
MHRYSGVLHPAYRMLLNPALENPAQFYRLAIFFRRPVQFGTALLHRRLAKRCRIVFWKAERTGGRVV